VFDQAFKPFTFPGGFVDPNLPAGFAPFNVQEIAGRIVVAGSETSTTTGKQSVAIARFLGDHTVLTAGQSAVTTGTTSVADPSFFVIGMEGGAGGDCGIDDGCRTDDDCASHSCSITAGIGKCDLLLASSLAPTSP